MQGEVVQANGAALRRARGRRNRVEWIRLDILQKSPHGNMGQTYCVGCTESSPFELLKSTFLQLGIGTCSISTPGIFFCLLNTMCTGLVKMERVSLLETMIKVYMLEQDST